MCENETIFVSHFSTFAGSTVPHINKSYSPAGLYTVGAAGPTVSAEGLSQCDTAQITIVIFQ